MADQSVFSRALPGVRWAEVRSSHSMLTIALRELGDASRWTEIVAINGLVFPYISDLAGVGVAVPGQLIKVPSLTGYVTADNDAAGVFGTDVKLQGGMLTAQGGDFAVEAGRANLRQALGIRIRVDQRELLFHPDYGCRIRRLIGKGAAPTVGLLAAQYVKSALLADDRVSRVIRSTATVTGESISVEASVEAVGGTVVDVAGVI